MGYSSRFGNRGYEFASKTAHSYIVRSPEVQAFLSTCQLPRRASEVSFDRSLLKRYSPVEHDPIRTIVAIDGGYTEVVVQPDFPSSTICFFQFGVLLFGVEDLKSLEEQPFIDPEDMSKKLKRVQRFKLVLPMRNVTSGGEPTLTASIRRTLHEFFCQDFGGGSLAETLRWFLFAEYLGRDSLPSWQLATSPVGQGETIELHAAKLNADYTWTTPDGVIYITDVLRLHERIDDELGAGGIQSYVITAIEQLLLVHVIRLALRVGPPSLRTILFIKDGPLAFFGQTARLHEPMRALVRFLFEHHDLYLAGLEKSGQFVEHAHEIKQKLAPGDTLVLDNEYIYQYVLPAAADPASPYGRTTYYSTKLIFKSLRGSMHVVTVPTTEARTHPKWHDLRNLDVVLTNLERLRCDMYDDALMPIALANKLVSLSNHPSRRILQLFATGAIG